MDEEKEMAKRIMIEEILNGFDFDKVKVVMAALDWKWGANMEAHAPTYNELRETAKMLLEDSYLMGHSAAGGFEAEDIEGVLRLIFVVTQAESEFEEK